MAQKHEGSLNQYMFTWQFYHREASSSVVPTKGFHKRNIANVGMAPYMNALADKVQNKKCHAHSDMHFKHDHTHYSTNIPTYVAVAYALVYVLCQPVHSCIEPFLHQLDLF